MADFEQAWTNLDRPSKRFDGNVARHTLDRLDSFMKGTAGKRLTYKKLIAQTVN